MKFILFLKVKDPWLRLSQLNFYQNDPFFYKIPGRVTRIVCVTHCFGRIFLFFFMSLFFLDFTVSLSSSNHFVFLLLVVEVVVVVVVEATLGITRSRRGGRIVSISRGGEDGRDITS